MQFKLAIQGMGWIGKRDDVDVGRGKWKGYTVLARARGLSPLSLCVCVCVCACSVQCPVRFSLSVLLKLCTSSPQVTRLDRMVLAR